jgi:hypothetical protein
MTWWSRRSAASAEQLVSAEPVGAADAFLVAKQLDAEIGPYPLVVAQPGTSSHDLSITRQMLGVELDGSRRICPAHVRCLVDLVGSRRLQSDRLDDHRDDQGAFDSLSDGTIANAGLRYCWGLLGPGSSAPGRPWPTRERHADTKCMSCLGSGHEQAPRHRDRLVWATRR